MIILLLLKKVFLQFTVCLYLPSTLRLNPCAFLKRIQENHSWYINAAKHDRYNAPNNSWTQHFLQLLKRGAIARQNTSKIE